MSKNKKIIVGVIIVLLIIVIGIVVAYKLIENNVMNRENFKFNVENISSEPIDTVNNDRNKENTEETIFDAEIKRINTYNGITTVLVKGFETNEINYRGEFDFSIDDDTKILWIEPNSIKSNYTEIDVLKLKKGQKVTITSIGDILESYPAQLTKVTKVVVLNDKL